MPARSWPVRSCVTSEMALQPIAGQLQQLWRGREIPICVNRVDVTEIGRQDRQSRAWIIVVAIGVKDGVDRKAVSKIVQSRPACCRTWLDTGPTNKPLERILHIRIEQPRARWREEQGRDVRRLARTIGAAEIGGKGGDRTRM